MGNQIKKKVFSEEHGKNKQDSLVVNCMSGHLAFTLCPVYPQ